MSIKNGHLGQTRQ